MNISANLFMSKVQSLKFWAVLPQYKRMVLPMMICLLLVQGHTRGITLNVLSDAFWQVAVFVAMSLTIYHLFADKVRNFYTNSKGESKPHKEIMTASFMGILPGCGGAIVVITQYVSGQMGFGSVVAVLTSTMGDAAFLLLAAEPSTGAGIICLCFFVGVASGLIVNKVHGPSFLRHTIKTHKKTKNQKKASHTTPTTLKYQGVVWKWLMIPGTIIGLLMAAQIDIVSLFNINESTVKILGATIALTLIFLWAATCEITNYESMVSEDKKNCQNKIFQKVALDTNFVTSWVVVAFIFFELIMLYGNIQLESLFLKFATFTPLAGVIIGMIPGCGPQIITTSLYLSGAIPLSAQIGNAISNDGDALFPAIALSPKVALIATMYSSVPAIIVAYSYYWLFE